MQNHVNQKNYVLCVQSAQHLCEQAIRNGKRPVILANSYEESLTMKRSLAQAHAGFGVAVDTLGHWSSDVWETFGDGSNTVDSMTRTVRIQHLLSNDTKGHLPHTSGITNLLTEVAQKALPYAVKYATAEMHSNTNTASAADSEAGNTTAQPSHLSAAEHNVLSILADYQESLTHDHLCEPCTQIFHLTHMSDVLDAFCVICFDINEQGLSRIERDFLTACNATFIHNVCEPSDNKGDEIPTHIRRKSSGNAPSNKKDLDAPNAPSISPEIRALRTMLFRRSTDEAPLAPQGDILFDIAAGPTASLTQIAQRLFGLSESYRSIAVVTPSPYATSQAIGEALKGHNISFAVHDSLALTSTAIGQAIYYLLQMVQNAEDAGKNTRDNDSLAAGHLDVLQAADFERNMFSGATIPSGFRIEQMERGNRLITCDEVLSDIAENGQDLNGIVSNFETGDYSTACQTLDAYITDHFHGSSAQILVQKNALSQCELLFDAGKTAGLTKNDMAQILETLHVPIRQTTAQNSNSTCVTFCTMSEIARIPEYSFDAVLFCDMDETHYPLLPAEDALHTLLAKIDCAQDGDAPLLYARHTFANACACASKAIVLQRTHYDIDGNENIPSAMYAEVVDCYRDSLKNDDDFNDVTSLPEKLSPFVFQRGEEFIEENALFGRPRPTTHAATLPPTGHLSAENKHLIVLPRGKNPDPDIMDLSASQIESYLECPYKWFAERRMALESLDEGFGPLQRGSFMHVIMQTFYETMHENGMQRVTSANLHAAQDIMKDVFHNLSDHQFEMRANSNRYVPINAQERAERDEMLPKLLAWLSTEAQMLPGFHPAAFEWEFGNPVPFTYAGVHIVGSVDRIDVDDHGHAVVVDYKSSLNDGFRLHEPPQSENAKKRSKSRAHADQASEQASVQEEDSIEKTQEPFTLPRKMQALIYARVVEDMFRVYDQPVSVVGAIYLNPLKTQHADALQGQAQGAFDRVVVDANTLPFATKGDRGAGQVPYAHAKNFDELIQKSEQLVAKRLQNLANGDIKPNPLEPAHDICQYCPVTTCPRREA